MTFLLFWFSISHHSWQASTSYTISTGVGRLSRRGWSLQQPECPTRIFVFRMPIGLLASLVCVLDSLNFTFDYFQFDIAEFAFGQLPVLEVDGVRINQSRVICAYVAKQCGKHLIRFLSTRLIYQAFVILISDLTDCASVAWRSQADCILAVSLLR